MTSQPYRLPQGGRIDRSRPLQFIFNDRSYGGYLGDTLASALLANGVTLVGRAESFRSGRATFHPDLAENIARGDKNYLAVLDRADAYVERNGLDLPPDPEARRVYPEPECVAHPILELDLAKAGISSIIWATGYVAD